MPNVIFPGAVGITSLAWTSFKSTAITGKALAVQYDDDGTVYTVFALDGSFVYTCTIWKGTVPDYIVNGGYSQFQNDSDKSDFENNYKGSANKNISNLFSSQVSGYVTTSGTTNTAVRATAFVEQSSNAGRSLVSTNTNDTSAGTGARTVRITYYDQTMAGPFTEDVTMNGTSAVNTVSTTICFVEKLTVLTVGSSGGNAGSINLTAAASGAGGTIAQIAIGDNQTQYCHHYVNSSKTMHIVELAAGGQGTSGGKVTIRKATPTDSTKPELVLSSTLRVPSGNEVRRELRSTIEVTGPARVTLYAQGDTANVSITWFAGFGYFEV
jgi:hypothetical protein